MHKAEPSQGLLTMQFLQQNLSNILLHEAEGDNCMRLYHVGRMWIALEKSAFRLKDLEPTAIVTPALFPGCKVPVVVASIDHQTWLSLSRHLPAVTSSSAHAVVIPQPQIPSDGYRRWHQSTLAPFLRP